MIAQLDSLYLHIRPWKLWSRMLSYVLFEGRPLTTRGQWINPVVFAHLNVAKHLPPLQTVRKPVFILGTGRSGTTVLGIMLSMHREVGFLNEPKALWHVIHPDEDLIGSYSRGKAHYRLKVSDVTPTHVQCAHRLYGTYLRSTFSKRVVDKYPELVFRVPFIKKLFPDAKFLFLVRNGWDTCHSIEGWSSRLGQKNMEGTQDWWGLNKRKWHLLIDQIVKEHGDLAQYANDMDLWEKQTDMAAVEWIVTMREGLKLLEQYNKDILRVNFEELCLKPRQKLDEIITFLELAVDDDSFFLYGEKTLKPIQARLHFTLNPSIQKPFIETMIGLGYEI